MERYPGLAIKKAELIEAGRVRLAIGTRLPVFPIRDHGGPTSTERHMVLSSGRMVVKLAIEEAEGMDRTPFVLEPARTKGRFHLIKRGDVFLDDVEVLPVAMHAPGQAFMNLDERCSCGCLFCSSTGLAGDALTIDYPASRWVEILMKAREVHDIEAVALTSGTGPDIRRTIALYIDVIRSIKQRHPDMPIGVEPNATTREDLVAMHDAGAEELKLNVQVLDDVLFKKACPRLDKALIMRMLKAGVEVFGRNRVASNVIIGLGERDEDVLKGVEDLARMGVAANIRSLRVAGPVMERLAGLHHPVSAERMLGLALAQKGIFKRHGLDPTLFKTMCHRCGCCDICVGKDI
jgi:hypothetical protein